MITPRKAESEAGGSGAAGHESPRMTTGEAVAILAHEIRSPLGVIRNALEILRITHPADRVIEHQFGVMERQVRQLGRLIGDLLDLTRIAAGKLEMREEWLDLAVAFDHAVEACRPQLEPRRQRLSISLPPGPVSLRADPARLRQILVNLLTNAAKYTEPDGRIWLTAEASTAEVVVRVADTGMGIAPEVLPHVFELFQQGPGHECRESGGLGIGLALVKWLVELHGGSVAAHSDGPGKGSEFVVRLPAVKEPAVTKAALALVAPHRHDAPGPDQFDATIPRGEFGDTASDGPTMIRARDAVGE